MPECTFDGGTADIWISVSVPIIMADQPGTGKTGCFIDSLKAGFDRVEFPSVISNRLEGMLERRGFKRVEVTDSEFCDGKTIEIYRWNKYPEGIIAEFPELREEAEDA